LENVWGLLVNSLDASEPSEPFDFVRDAFGQANPLLQTAPQIAKFIYCGLRRLHSPLECVVEGRIQFLFALIKQVTRYN